MTHSDEIKRVVLNHLLDTYHHGEPLNDLHWQAAYHMVRADCLLDTLRWKLEHLTVTL